MTASRDACACAPAAERQIRRADTGTGVTYPFSIGDAEELDAMTRTAWGAR